MAQVFRQATRKSDGSRVSVRVLESSFVTPMYVGGGENIVLPNGTMCVMSGDTAHEYTPHAVEVYTPDMRDLFGERYEMP